MFNHIKKFFDFKNILLLSFAFITSLLNCIGSEFETGYLSANFSILVFLLKLIIITFILFMVTSFLTKFLMNININTTNDKTHSKKFFIFSFLVIFVFWFIVLLAYYPGLLVYDYWNQINMIETGINEHHPLIHTLYLNFFYRIFDGIVDSKVISIFISTIIQMIVFDLSLSYLNYILYRIDINKKIIIFLVIFEAILPIFSVLSISHTKDVFFSAFFVLFIASNIEYIYLKKEFNKIIYILSVVGIIISRNQGLYIFIVYLLFIIIKNKNLKKYLNKITIYGFLIGIFSLFLLRVLTHARSGKKAEFVSVPAQAIARIDKLYIDDFDEETKKLLKKVIKENVVYEPFRSDSVKNNLELADFPNFANVIKKTIIRYPHEYLLSAYLLYIGYLYINDVQHAHIYKIVDEDNTRSTSGYFMTRSSGFTEINTYSKFKTLEKLYENLFSKEEYQKLFLIRYLFSPALYFYILFYSMILSIINKKEELHDIYVFIVLFVGTMLLGPCTLIRYALPYICITMPMLFVSIRKNN